MQRIRNEIIVNRFGSFGSQPFLTGITTSTSMHTGRCKLLGKVYGHAALSSRVLPQVGIAAIEQDTFPFLAKMSEHITSNHDSGSCYNVA